MKLQKEPIGVGLSVAEAAALAYPAGDIGIYRSERVSSSSRTLFLESYGTEDGFVADVALTGTVQIPEDLGDAFVERTCFDEEGKEALLPYSVTLSGMADGVIPSEAPHAPDRLFLILPHVGYDAGGQFRRRFRTRLLLLGYLYCLSHDTDAVTLCTVSIAGAAERKLRCESECCSARQLREEMIRTLQLILPITDFLVTHHTTVVPQAGEVCFPYPALREGQEELIRAVYRTLKRGKRLFAEAPTGIGKTISTLYPAVKALGNGAIDKIFYLTAKASTRREAFLASGKLFHAGAKLRTVVVTAKEQVCLLKKEGDKGCANSCNPFDCPYADGYYERAPGAILSLLSKQNGYTRTSIVECAKEHRVCPYELSLDLSEKCDIVICDYNYVFDPQVYFRRYFGEDRSIEGKYAFLIDEGHNLADRARDMYSGDLTRNRVMALCETVPKEDFHLRHTLEELLDGFAALRLLCADTLTRREDGSEAGFYMSKEAPSSFTELLKKTEGAIKEWLRTAPAVPYRNDISDLRRDLTAYLLLLGYADDAFLTMVRVRNYDIEARIFCLDPSKILDDCLSRAYASVIFSATLTPIDYFTDLLGGKKKAETLSLPSPFPTENLCVAVYDGVSTRFETRDRTYRTVASAIAATVSGKKGNYIVYFPSYAYLDAVKEAFTRRYSKVNVVVQERRMTVAARESFLDAFRDDGKLRVGFCVLGGSFSEGVDLPGGRLIGVVIVGVGLPGLSEEGNILRDYYENTKECGYDYAYTYPGMNRVLQAAGRVIRTDTDKGVVVLLDDRYASPLYRTLFPPHWQGMQYAGNSASLAEIMRRFWEKAQK